MRINVEIISKLGPCESRFNNFKEQYPNFDDHFHEFLKLENITYDDKIQVSVRLLSKNQLVKWSIMCAESVLHIFEEKRPEDKRVRECLELLDSFSDFENLSVQEKQKICTAANAAYAAANAANAAYAAANAVNAAANSAAKEEQRNLNLLFLASLVD